MPPPLRKYFISDNAAGVHPEVMAALAAANQGYAIAYGHDDYTQQALEALRAHFGAHTEIFFVLTGTAANVLALQSVLHGYEAVICADCAHLHRDECGAPEKFIGVKLLPAPTRQGKLSPEAIESLLSDTRMVHRVQPRVVTISQCTEWGTVYTPFELQALAEFCHAHNLLLHVDGARLSNAAAALQTSLAGITADCGVDILSLGGSKNGLMAAEAVVFFDATLAKTTAFYRKQAMQLCSKMRYVAVQLHTLFAGDLWRRNAQHANAMAAALAVALHEVQPVDIVMPVESNAIFARIPPAWLTALQAEYAFALWDSRQSIVRWMTAFDTTPADVQAFATAIKALGHA